MWYILRSKISIEFIQFHASNILYHPLLLIKCDSAELQYKSFQVLLAWDLCPQAYENYVKEVRSGSDAYLNSTDTKWILVSIAPEWWNMNGIWSHTSTVNHGVFRGSGMDMPSQGTPYLLGSWNPSWGQFPGDKYSRHMPQEDGSSASAFAVVIGAHVGMVLWNSFRFSDFCQVFNSFVAQMLIIYHSYSYSEFFFSSFPIILATILSSLSNFTTKPQWSLVKWLTMVLSGYLIGNWVLRLLVVLWPFAELEMGTSWITMWLRRWQPMAIHDILWMTHIYYMISICLGFAVWHWVH